jgi:hypothetical protein
MNPNWRSFLESAEGLFDGESAELLNFGDAAGELQAASRQTVVVPLTHLGLIEAVGEDAKPSCTEQLTSDINHLAPGQWQHSAGGSAKGPDAASFVAWRDGRCLSPAGRRRPAGSHPEAPADVRACAPR